VCCNTWASVAHCTGLLLSLTVWTICQLPDPPEGVSIPSSRAAPGPWPSSPTALLPECKAAGTQYTIGQTGQTSHLLACRCVVGSLMRAGPVAEQGCSADAGGTAQLTFISVVIILIHACLHSKGSTVYLTNAPLIEHSPYVV
jgi:hypothetical protein